MLSHSGEGAKAIVRISMLGAGFVCGVGGRNVTSIQRRTGVSITSSLSHAGGSVRVFKVTAGEVSQVKAAVSILQEAVEVYKSLTEGDFRGQYVEPEVVVQGIRFLYAPPPKHKMPNAACVRKLPQSLLFKKEAEQAFMSVRGVAMGRGSHSRESQDSHHLYQSYTGNQHFQSLLERDASSSVDSNESATIGSLYDPSRDPFQHQGRPQRRQGHLSDPIDRRLDGIDAVDGIDHHREQYQLSKEVTPRKRYPGSNPASPHTCVKDFNRDRATNPLRITHSTPSLSDLMLSPDRANRDWREKPKGNQPRNLLRDFQGMHV